LRVHAGRRRDPGRAGADGGEDAAVRRIQRGGGERAALADGGDEGRHRRRRQDAQGPVAPVQPRPPGRHHHRTDRDHRRHRGAGVAAGKQPPRDSRKKAQKAPKTNRKRKRDGLAEAIHPFFCSVLWLFRLGYNPRLMATPLMSEAMRMLSSTASSLAPCLIRLASWVWIQTSQPASAAALIENSSKSSLLDAGCII